MILVVLSGQEASTSGGMDPPEGVSRGPDAEDWPGLPFFVPPRGVGAVAEVAVVTDVLELLLVVVAGELPDPEDLGGVPGILHRSAGSVEPEKPE